MHSTQPSPQANSCYPSERRLGTKCDSKMTWHKTAKSLGSVRKTHNEVHPLWWWDGLSASRIQRAMPVGAYTPGSATHAGQVEG